MSTVQEQRAAALERSPDTLIAVGATARYDWRNRGVDAKGLRTPECARRFRTSELRAAPEFVEWNGEQRYQLDGIASTTNQPYRMWDLFGEYDEVIDGHAFDETLATGPDVAFLVNHGGVTMARSIGSRPSLTLGVNSLGLTSQAFVNPDRRDVADLVHAIRDGDVTEMSFAFRIEDGEWNEEYTQFTISKVSLDRGDVSAVNYGANPNTSIAVRSVDVLDDLDHLPLAAARAALARLNAREDLGPEPQKDRQPSNVVSEHGPELTVPGPEVPLDQRADLGRSLALVRTEWFIADEFDD